jgi:peptidoglycan/xylan/chitin deacetylase (PgdA/CDA1 family)
VHEDEKAFSADLYMSTNQLKEMVKNNMHIGHHGYDHYWLETLSREKQQTEIKKGCDFLATLGVNMSNWTICYPYGSFNANAINVVKEQGCRLGFSTHVDVADLNMASLYTLSRLDTNDIPKNKDELTNAWFDKA